MKDGEIKLFGFGVARFMEKGDNSGLLKDIKGLGFTLFYLASGKHVMESDWKGGNGLPENRSVQLRSLI
jgi:hypothetical protein